jgi:uncharacterized protein (TIGR03067 family)
MRTLAFLLNLTALALTAQGAPAPLKAVKPDLERMQGSWDVVSEQNGPSPSRPMPGWQIVVASKRLKFVHRGSVITEWDCALDPSKKPKRLTLKGLGKSAGATMLGVYALKGDTFTFCEDNGRGRRPAGIAKVARGDVLYVLQRAKKR